MTNREAIKIIQTEQECVRRNWKENCDRNCGECDLVMDAKQTIEAYNMAIAALEEQGERLEAQRRDEETWNAMQDEWDKIKEKYGLEGTE